MSSTFSYLYFRPSDDENRPGVALPIKGGSGWSDQELRESSTRFVGHGSGRGPVYHSTTLNPYTRNVLIDSTTNARYYTSGIHEWSHSYWGYRTDAVFAQLIGKCWHFISVRLDPWDSSVECSLMGYYNGQLVNGINSPGSGITGPYTSIRISYSRAKELIDMGPSCIPVCEEMFDMLHPQMYLSWGSYSDHPFHVETKWKSPQCPYFGDYEWICSIGYYGCTSKLRLGLSMATEDMVHNLPRTDINLIATAIDVVKVLLGDVQAISSLADAWLSYRYVYTTNKLDIQSMRTYLNRISNLSVSDTFTSYGSYRDSHGTFRCQATFSTGNPDIIRVQEIAKEASRQLSLVNAWDLVPWSFVIDWILPIEDICRCIDTTSEIAELHPTSIWYSYEGVLDVGDNVFEKTYFRLPETTQFVTTPLTLFNQGGGETSDRTKTFRFLDSIALIIGR